MYKRQAYDLAFVDGDKDEYPAYVREATRLLRPGIARPAGLPSWLGWLLEPRPLLPGPSG